MIEKSLRSKMLIPEKGLETDIVAPITPEFALANKLAEPIMKQFGKYFQIRWKEELGLPECPYLYRWTFIFFGYRN